MKRVYIWFVGLCICVAALSGCGGQAGSVEQGAKEPSDTVVGTDSTTYRTENYDEVTVFCEGVNRVYVSSKGLAVSPNDTQCGGTP